MAARVREFVVLWQEGKGPIESETRTWPEPHSSAAENVPSCPTWGLTPAVFSPSLGLVVSWLPYPDALSLRMAQVLLMS